MIIISPPEYGLPIFFFGNRFSFRLIYLQYNVHVLLTAADFVEPRVQHLQLPIQIALSWLVLHFN
jgi:hypothetical protein